MSAANAGRDRKNTIRADWEEIKDDIMFKTLLAKFLQHPELKNELVNTKDHLVIEHLNNQHIAVAELPEDYYWEISEEQRYDPAQNPKDLRLGQLSEDWDRVQQIVKGDAPPVGYALVWLASLLRKIGSANVA